MGGGGGGRATERGGKEKEREGGSVHVREGGREEVDITHLLEELAGVHELAGPVCNMSAALLSPTVVQQVLVLYVVPSSNHKHIGLCGGELSLSLSLCLSLSLSHTHTHTHTSVKGVLL